VGALDGLAAWSTATPSGSAGRRSGSPTSTRRSSLRRACEHERELGETAKYRLQALLNAGPFSLAAGPRDEDSFGRKLRTVLRAGRSIGARLVAEGLVRRWYGGRRSWCD